ncbi:uncharacterized protein LOC133785638 [Humulus lupulus]|uniref:uncharacterized protein LOC133785638 n=1 Tax=Humulus lupulus TaxID=3486 RepID=UPI002B401CDF|nr:uncharacterized protein LOC133785638 [Humulus lupulus]
MNGEKEEDNKKGEILKKEPLVANSGSITFSDNPPKITTPLPFPLRFHKKAIEEKFVKIMNIFKKIHINIPFVDSLEQMPNYANFMKEVMSKKRKLEDYEIVKLTEECSAIIKRQLSEKLSDPKSFTIPHVIGDLHIEKALCDLGAIDFVVLNMEEDQEIPIILGRPFLATGKALIDIHDGNLTLRVNGEEVKFNISNTMKFPKEQANCKRVDVVTPCLRDFFKIMFHNDPLELCLTTPISKDDLGVDLGMTDVEVIDSVLALEALPVENEMSKKEDIIKAPTLDNSLEKEYY